MEPALALSAPARWPDLWGHLQSPGRTGRKSLVVVGEMVSSRSPGGLGGWAGSHPEPLLASKLTPFSSGWFAVYEVSPTPPITVTHKPEEDTFGVSHFLVKRRSFTDFI